MERIGIIGAGNIGTAVATLATRAGMSVDIANSRGPESLADLVAQLGPLARAVDPMTAAQAPVVLLAVNWYKLDAAWPTLPADWGGRILIDATNPMSGPGIPQQEPPANSSAVLSTKVPGARVVKAFNHLYARMLYEPQHPSGGRRVLFYSGNDTDARAVVGDLLTRFGFAAVDLGPLSVGGPLAQYPTGALSGKDFVQFG